MTDTSVTGDIAGSELTATVTISADPQRVWDAVSDLARMRAWSPQVRKTFILGGPVSIGTRFVNINGDGWKRWPTTAKVVRYAPRAEFAFRVTENRTVWSFTLDETPDGTRLTQRRETPDGISPLSRILVGLALGGQETFTASMLAGMRQTLERLKSDLER